MYSTLTFLIFSIFLNNVNAGNIEVLECEPPDYPEFGGYGPTKNVYTPGDTIHYYCNVDTYIGGNYLRICLDSGDWSGNTPVCDPRVDFTEIRQTSTAAPDYKNEAEAAVDGSKSSCSETQTGPNQEWTAVLPDVSQVLRIMLFLPKGDVAYEVFIVKADGSRFSCGGHERRMERLEWTFHNCIEPHNTGVVSLVIKSKSDNIPLRLCEVVAHALTNPTCTDPHHFVENGRMMISRKSASLICDRGYLKSRDSKLRCIRTGVWQRKLLYCIDNKEHVESVPVESSGSDQTGNQC